MFVYIKNLRNNLPKYSRFLPLHPVRMLNGTADGSFVLNLFCNLCCIEFRMDVRWLYIAQCCSGL